MILTPIDPKRLPLALDTFAASLGTDVLAREVFARIAATRRLCPDLTADLHAGRGKAVGLAARLGIATIDEDPAVAFSWDGGVIRTRSETSVVFHEVAHWQIAPLARRGLPDFGLGAGPETGRIAEANAAACTDDATKEEEENLASLLGILWEVQHDEPALLAFAEQNWLELFERPSTAQHFARCLAELQRRNLVGGDGQPLLRR
ncbi:MAG: hypothetical protein EPO08_12925 [Rhodospirillaceae bacterium]|nr:MAG: hypothetical protein EPO08_12925 [Rhodospirillaceae bacterium]